MLLNEKDSVTDQSIETKLIMEGRIEAVCLQMHLPDTCCRSCHTWTVWSETSFQLQNKRQEKVLKERREAWSSCVQTLNKPHSGIGGYGFCYGCHCCPGSSLVSGSDQEVMQWHQVQMQLHSCCNQYYISPKRQHYPSNMLNGDNLEKIYAKKTMGNVKEKPKPKPNPVDWIGLIDL